MGCLPHAKWAGIQPRYGRPEVAAAILAAVSPGFQPGVGARVIHSREPLLFFWRRPGRQDADGYGRQDALSLQIGALPESAVNHALREMTNSYTIVNWTLLSMMPALMA